MKQSQIVTEPEFLTAAQAMNLLQIGPYAFYEGCRTGQIPHIRIGRLIRVPKVKLVKLLEDTLKGPC